MQKEKGRLERLNKDSIEAKVRADRAEQLFHVKEQKLAEKLEAQKIFIERNNHFVVLGKKLNEFVNNYTLGARGKVKNAAVLDEVKKFIAIEKTKRVDLINKEKQEKEKANLGRKKVNNTNTKISKIHIDDQAQPILVGSRVKIDNSKNLATVESIDEKAKMAVVVSGALKFTMPLERLTAMI